MREGVMQLTRMVASLRCALARCAAPRTPRTPRSRLSRRARSGCSIPFAPGGATDIIARVLEPTSEQAARPADRHRQPLRRGRQHRGRARRAGAARRLHAARRQHLDQFDQSASLRGPHESERAEGPRADHEARRDPEFHPRQPEAAGRRSRKRSRTRRRARAAQLPGAARLVFAPRHAGAHRARPA